MSQRLGQKSGEVHMRLVVVPPSHPSPKQWKSRKVLAVLVVVPTQAGCSNSGKVGKYLQYFIVVPLRLDVGTVEK